MTAQHVENPFAGQGSVLLDIGGDIGALVVTMPAELDGLEVEIRPVGGPDLHSDPRASGNQAGGHHHAHDHSPDGHTHDHPSGIHPHVAVVSRPVGAGSVPSLVFPELVEGGYELYEKGTHEVTLTVQVRGGDVATASWPQPRNS
ncbi:hypothetical protein [Nocardioides sp.]|uniref:hypothetical protein n=1 Tax=Nocardioides sp. TaxID=35761 RepID=UPI003D0D6AED